MDTFEKRRDDFRAKYEALVKEYQVDTANYPVWIPDGTGGWKTVMQVTIVDIHKPETDVQENQQPTETK